MINTIELSRVKAFRAQRAGRGKRRGGYFRFGAALLVLAFASSVQAQVAGRISGFIRDSTGAVILDAQVRAVSVEQQLERTVASDGTGYYILLAMPPGTYTVTAEIEGFETQAQQGVELTLNQSLRLDFSMAVGSVTTEVTVESTATLVNTENQTLGALVDERRVLDLPLNGRNVMALAKTLPGVAQVVAPQEMRRTRGGPNMSVNGGRSVNNNYTFNGANFIHFGRTTGLNYPPPDAVQEIQIQTHNFTSEHGNNSGSQVSVTSKTGTNEFHGTAWEFLRNDQLNARSFFQPRRPVTRQNQTGFALGGPIRRDKIFVFGHYQKLWNRPEVGSTQAFLPSPLERQGDFSQSGVTLRNPTDGLTGEPLMDLQGFPCVQNNVISPSCMSPAAQNVLSQFIPTTPNNIFVAQNPEPSGSYSFMTRVDLLQSSNHTMFGHYFRDHYSRTFARGTIKPYNEADAGVDNHNASFSSTYTFTPTFLNEATVSFVSAVSFEEPNTLIDPNSLGIPVPVGTSGEGLSITAQGRFSLSHSNPNGQNYRNYHFRDVMSWIKGRHTFKWGFEYWNTNWALNTAFTQGRSVSFTGNRSGDATADFVLGTFDSLNVTFGQPGSDPIAKAYHLFIQDQWKIRPRFTLTYGVRWEPYLPWDQEFGRHTAPDLAGGFTARSTVKPDSLPGVLHPGDPGLPENGKLTFNDMNNFGPRVGFAWDVFGDGKFSVRGGYGIFYDRISATTVHSAEAPYRGNSNLENGLLDDPFGSLNEPLPPLGILPGEFGCSGPRMTQTLAELGGPRAPGYPFVTCEFPTPQRLVLSEDRMVLPYTQSINLTLQRQLRPDLMLEASYVSKLSQKLDGHRHWNPAVFGPSLVTGAAPSSRNVNERVLYFETLGLMDTRVRVMGNDYRAGYHSFQLNLNKRFSRGFSFLGSYVLSKNISNMVDPLPGISPGVGNPFNLLLEKGRSLFDQRHIVRMSWIWSPGGPASGAAKHLLGDWTFTGLTSILSGAPVHIGQGTDVALDGTGQRNLQHAQFKEGITHDDLVIDHSSRDAMTREFFNTDAFVNPRDLAPGTYGNAGRNLVSGPATVNTDFAVMKDFYVGEPIRIQIRGEFFNVFNQVNFAQPERRVQSGSFGRIRSADAGRIAQLALKVIW